jgi:uncharacterized protein YndB with AHSA1/START domain
MLLPGKSWAEVADSGATGFTVKHSYLIQAAPAEVYRRLLRVGEWWNSEHTYSRDARNLSIEDHAGGCFCEKLANGSVLHMTVEFASPGKLLRMSGGLGPLQTVASAGSMTVELQPEGAGTRLNLTYMVSGYQAGGMASWAAPVNQVLGEQFGRLKNLIESGDPAVAAQPK